jgi:hypothetical protein
MSEPATSAPPALSRDAVAAYLAALYGGAPRGSLVELRYRTAGGMGRSFHPAGDREVIAAEILARAPATDVYLGVLPRRRRGRGDLVPEAAVLWADCDTPEALAALSGHWPGPSIVVASGSADNAHAYWLLSRPEPLAAIEEGNRRLADRLGADPACADAARILRPPSLNHKHRPPAPVRLVRCAPGFRHLITDVVGELSGDRAPRSAGSTHALADDDPLRRIAPVVYVERLTGAAVPRDRKIRCPFHADRTPSLHVYRDPARGWYCFGCRRGGSIYDFAAYLCGRETRGVSFAELHDELCVTFGPATSLHPEPADAGVRRHS